jgi:hypothetical protein
MHRSIRSLVLPLAVLIPLSACAPQYQPRQVPIPADCDVLLRNATEEGVRSLSEAELKQLQFCQQQHLLRAEEEQAEYAKYQVRNARSAYIYSLISLAFFAAAVIADSD